jgi:hypothetical protein
VDSSVFRFFNTCKNSNHSCTVRWSINDSLPTKLPRVSFFIPLIEPESEERNPDYIEIKVVFPLPLGPTNPYSFPSSSIFRETDWSA